MKTLQDYLTENYNRRGIMDYHIRAFVPEGQMPTLYLHPRDTDGETLDFVVVGNQLSSPSDVQVSGLPELPADANKAMAGTIAVAVEAVRSGKLVSSGEAKMCLTRWGARLYAWRARRHGFQTEITDCGPYQRQERGGRYSVSLKQQNH